MNPPRGRGALVGGLLLAVLLARGALALVSLGREVTAIPAGRQVELATASADERLRGTLGDGYRAFEMLRAHAPEDATVLFLNEPSGELAETFLRCQALLFPRRLLQYMSAPPGWDSTSTGVADHVFVLEVGTDLGIDWSRWMVLVAEDGELRLWRGRGRQP